jgi:peptidoglycan biosynthesis protein MviN/MurJ (putative lipid II flippase)
VIGRLISVGGFTALSRIAGFFRDVIMAAILGAGVMSDAFMVAFRLPNNFRALFAEGAFNAAFLPRFASAAAKSGTGPSSPAARFADDVFAWQFVAQLVLLVALLPSACVRSSAFSRRVSRTIPTRCVSRSISPHHVSVSAVHCDRHAAFQPC